MSENIKAKFAAALADMENPAKDSENPHFKSRYASLGAVLATVKPCLSKHGLTLAQCVEPIGELWTLATYVMDAEGNTWRIDQRPFSFSGTPQQNGSEETYLRRYALMCCMGLSAEDDDANQATDGATARQTAKSNMVDNLTKAYKAWRDRNGMTDDEAKAKCLDWIGKPISRDLSAKDVNTLLDYMREDV